MKNLLNVLMIIVALMMLIGCGDDGSDSGGNGNNPTPGWHAQPNNQYDSSGNCINCGSSAYPNDDPFNYDAPRSNSMYDILGEWRISFNYDGKPFTFLYDIYYVDSDTILAMNETGDSVSVSYGNTGTGAIVDFYSADITLTYSFTVYGNTIEGCFYPEADMDTCYEASGYKL